MQKYLQDIDGLPATLSDKMSSLLTTKVFLMTKERLLQLKAIFLKMHFPVCDNMLVIEFHADNGIIHNIMAVNKTLCKNGPKFQACKPE